MKTTKKRPLTDAQKLAIEQRAFKRKIHNIFVGMGFEYIPTGGKELYLDHRAVEIDSLYIYENIWLICEDTVKKTNIRDHIRTKNEAFGEIRSNISKFVELLLEKLPESGELLRAYNQDRILLFGLYIPKYDPSLTEDDIKLFSNICFVFPNTLNYFQWLVKAIRLSSRNELFRFLELDERKIGLPTSTAERTEIKAPIIYPKDFVGRLDNVRVVSFMMSAENLMDSAYVLRKDSWNKSIYLYQRLLNKDKIGKIRRFIEEKGEAFYNNIIVVLPDDVYIQLEDGSKRSIGEVKDLPEKCELIIPKKRNSICIIDGQHRVFAHYESGMDTAQERKIAKLRKKLHLLVTGLIFDPNISKADRIKIQSEIFLDINSNASPVAPSVLLQIKRIKYPTGDESLAQLTIEKLNSSGLFKGLFQNSELESGGIKTASIVRFALRYLVTLNPIEGKKSLINYWSGDIAKLKEGDEYAIDEYASYCASVLRTYFGAVKKRFVTEWDDPTSKLLSVIAINGFIIALTRQLPKNGVNDFDFYKKAFDTWTFDFSKEAFPYTSSQYRKFSTDILRDAFHFSENEINTF